MASSIVCSTKNGDGDDEDDLGEEDNYGLTQVCDILGMGNACDNWSMKKRSAKYRFSEPCKHLGLSPSEEMSLPIRKSKAKKRQKYTQRCDGSVGSKPSVIESSASDASTADGCNIDPPSGCNAEALGVGCVNGRSAKAKRFQEDQQRKQKIRELSNTNKALRERMLALEDAAGRLQPSASPEPEPSQSAGVVVQGVSDVGSPSRVREPSVAGSGKSDKTGRSLLDNEDPEQEHEDVPTLLYKLHTIEVCNHDLQDEMFALKKVVEGQRNVKQELHDLRERYRSVKSQKKEMESELTELRESFSRSTGENDFLSKKLAFLEKRKSEEVTLSDLINRDTATRAIILDLKHEIHDLKCEVAVERILKQRFKDELKRSTGDESDEATNGLKSLFRSEGEIREDIMREQQRLRREHMSIARKFQTNLNTIAGHYWREESLLRCEVDSMQTLMYEKGMEPFAGAPFVDRKEFTACLEEALSRRIEVNDKLNLVGAGVSQDVAEAEDEDDFSCEPIPIKSHLSRIEEDSEDSSHREHFEDYYAPTAAEESEEDDSYGPAAPLDPCVEENQCVGTTELGDKGSPSDEEESVVVTDTTEERRAPLASSDGGKNDATLSGGQANPEQSRPPSGNNVNLASFSAAIAGIAVMGAALSSKVAETEHGEDRSVQDSNNVEKDTLPGPTLGTPDQRSLDAEVLATETKQLDHRPCSEVTPTARECGSDRAQPFLGRSQPVSDSPHPVPDSLQPIPMAPILDAGTTVQELGEGNETIISRDENETGAKLNTVVANPLKSSESPSDTDEEKKVDDVGFDPEIKLRFANSACSDSEKEAKCDALENSESDDPVSVSLLGDNSNNQSSQSILEEETVSSSADVLSDLLKAESANSVRLTPSQEADDLANSEEIDVVENLTDSISNVEESARGRSGGTVDEEGGGSHESEELCGEGKTEAPSTPLVVVTGVLVSEDKMAASVQSRNIVPGIDLDASESGATAEPDALAFASHSSNTMQPIVDEMLIEDERESDPRQNKQTKVVFSESCDHASAAGSIAPDSLCSDDSVSGESSAAEKMDVPVAKTFVMCSSVDESPVLLALENYMCSAIDESDSHLVSQLSGVSDNQGSTIGSVSTEGRTFNLNPIGTTTEEGITSAASTSQPSEPGTDHNPPASQEAQIGMALDQADDAVAEGPSSMAEAFEGGTEASPIAESSGIDCAERESQSTSTPVSLTANDEIAPTTHSGRELETAQTEEMSITKRIAVFGQRNCAGAGMLSEQWDTPMTSEADGWPRGVLSLQSFECKTGSTSESGPSSSLDISLVSPGKDFIATDDATTSFVEASEPTLDSKGATEKASRKADVEKVEQPEVALEDATTLTIENEVRTMVNNFLTMNKEDSSDQESQHSMLPRREICVGMPAQDEANRVDATEDQNETESNDTAIVHSVGSEDTSEVPYCGEVAEQATEESAERNNSNEEDSDRKHIAQTDSDLDVASALGELLQTRKPNADGIDGEVVGLLSPILESKDVRERGLDEDVASPATAFLAYKRRNKDPNPGTKGAVVDLVNILQGEGPLLSVPSLTPSFDSTNRTKLLVLDTEYLKKDETDLQDVQGSDSSSWSTLSTSQGKVTGKSSKKETKPKKTRLKRIFGSSRKSSSHCQEQPLSLHDIRHRILPHEEKAPDTKGAIPEGEAIYEHDEELIPKTTRRRGSRTGSQASETPFFDTVGTLEANKNESHIAQDDVSELSQSMDGRALYPRRKSSSFGVADYASLESLPRFEDNRKGKKGSIENDWVESVVRGFASLWS